MTKRLDVHVTIEIQGKTVAAADVRDKSVGQALTQMGHEIGTKLAKVTCPEHQQGPTEIRVHVKRGGNADLRYESCCAKLRGVIDKALS